MDPELLTLTQELAEITRLVEDDDVPTTVRRFVTRVVRTVPHCHHAVVTVRGDDGFEVVADQPEPAVDLLAGGAHSGPGPIGEAIEHTEPRRLDDTATDQRWPAFSAALTRAGYRSALVLPLPVQRGPAAAFTFLSRDANAFGESSFDLVLTFALYAGAVVDNASLLQDSRALVEQLSTALGTRQAIGRAEGMLMRQFGIDVPTAFGMLQRASQNSNTKLRALAADLIAAHEAGSFADTLAVLGIEAPAA